MVGTTMGHCWRTLMVAMAVFLGALQGVGGRGHSELLFELGADDYPEFHEASSLDRSPEFAARRKHNFLPENSDGLLDSFEADSNSAKDVRKRRQPAVADPLLLKKWSEAFSAATPKFFQGSTLRNRGRSYFLKDYLGGKLHYLPAKKRPAYYSEPEGSEFLGGPGK